MKKVFLEAGKVGGTHGLKGEMRLQLWCDSVDFLKKFKRLYLEEDENNFLNIISIRSHGNVALVLAKEIDSVEKASAMRNKILYIKRDDANLEDGDYFIQELMDCIVVDVDDENKKYGVIVDISKTGANDVWHIKGEDENEYLIPAIPDVVKNVDVAQEIIKIKPLKGIFDNED